MATVNINSDFNIDGTLTASFTALGTTGSVFLTSDSGEIKTRTATQVLSDIGAATSGHTHSNYLSSTTTDTAADVITFEKGINMVDSQNIIFDPNDTGKRLIVFDGAENIGVGKNMVYNAEGSEHHFLTEVGTKKYGAIKASGYIKDGSTSSYVLLGDGGHTLLSNLTNLDWLRADAADIKSSGDLSFSEGVDLNFGTGDKIKIFANGGTSAIDLNTNNLLIRDGGTTKFTFGRTTGNFDLEGELHGKVPTSYTTYKNNYYFKDIPLDSTTSYDRRVLTLVPKSTANSVQNRMVVGKIIVGKYGSNIFTTYDIDIQSVYNSTYASVREQRASTVGEEARLVEFTYNGDVWIGLELSYQANPFTYASFYGYATDNVASGDQLQIISYYNENTATVINSDINSTITDYTGNQTDFRFLSGDAHILNALNFETASSATGINFANDLGSYAGTKIYLNTSEALRLETEKSINSILGGTTSGFVSDIRDSSENVLFRVRGDGYIGINKTVPTSLLHMEGGQLTIDHTSQQIKFLDAGVAQGLLGGTDNGPVIYSADGTLAGRFYNGNLYFNGNIYFKNNADTAERMRIYDSGNVSIGNTNNTYKLDVSGTGRFTGDVIVPTEAYGASWNASNEVPTKDAVYDKIESLSNPIRVKKSITSAELKNLASTPIEIIAAPSSGEIIHVLSAFIRFKYESTTYNTFQSPRLVYDTSSNKVWSWSRVAGSTTDQIQNGIRSNDENNMVNTEGLELTADTNVTTGDGIYDVYITYEIITL